MSLVRSGMSLFLTLALTLAIVFTATGCARLGLDSSDTIDGVLRYHASRRVEDPSVTLSVERGDFMRVLMGRVGLKKLLREGDASFEGSPMALAGFAGLFDRSTPDFEIVDP